LAEVRTLGHAVARGSIELVSTGVAVPVRDETGAVVAALSVVLPRDAPTDLALAELHRGRRQIERALGVRS
ncbi:MAG: IclR family transcriptional regulator C-terminal domain-containing protein, partial [Microcella sp.]|nr:IclR family transcriptional regulator C-terminal domain-containing protein [Microcella sp.]